MSLSFIYVNELRMSPSWEDSIDDLVQRSVYLAAVLRSCIKTITIIVYKMVVLFIACFTCTVLFLFVFCNFFVYCMIVLFVDNLFFFTRAASQ